MCFDDGDSPEACDARVLFARRENAPKRKCCECRCEIRKGEYYFMCSGIWDGEPQTFRRCELCFSCAEIISESEKEAGCGAYSDPPFGEVRFLRVEDYPRLAEASVEDGRRRLSAIYEKQREDKKRWREQKKTVLAKSL